MVKGLFGSSIILLADSQCRYADQREVSQSIKDQMPRGGFRTRKSKRPKSRLRVRRSREQQESRVSPIEWGIPRRYRVGRDLTVTLHLFNVERNRTYEQ